MCLLYSLVYEPPYNRRPYPYQEQQAHPLVTLMQADIGGLAQLHGGFILLDVRPFNGKV
jgi:hypothetical protein